MVRKPLLPVALNTCHQFGEIKHSGGREGRGWGACAADWNHSRSVFPDLLLNEVLHKHGKCWCWHMCYIPTRVLLHLSSCQKHFQLPGLCSGSVEGFSSEGLSLPCSCSSHQGFCIESRIRPSGSTRWHWWHKRKKCWCVYGPGSELFICSSNWLFAAHVFCSKDVSWAGGSDTRALGQSQLNQLLEFCNKCQSGTRTPPDQVGTLPPAPDAAKLCRIQVGLVLLVSDAADGECYKLRSWMKLNWAKMYLLFWIEALTGQ